MTPPSPTPWIPAACTASYCIKCVNELLRAGLKVQTDQPSAQLSFQVEPHPCLFRPGIDQDKLSQLLDDLDAEEIARKLRQ